MYTIDGYATNGSDAYLDSFTLYTKGGFLFYQLYFEAPSFMKTLGISSQYPDPATSPAATLRIHGPTIRKAEVE
jgi:hypothetical protein